MAIPVTVWNANQFALNIMVNRGPQTAVSAVSNTTWAPGTTAAGSGPGWDNGGSSTNNLGPGSNTVQVQLGTGQFTSITMNLPNTNPSSVQVYFFFGQQAVGSVSWFVLYSGSVVANGNSNISTAGASDAGAGAHGHGHGHAYGHDKKK
jgi:hypothetical protein